jgi:hypothetical protein
MNENCGVTPACRKWSQNRRKRMKFIKKLDSMKKAESLPALSTKGVVKKNRKG